MQTPPRIVSLLSAATEILYGLGLGEQVVGVSHECDWPKDASTKPRLTYSHIDAAASSKAIDDQVHAAYTHGRPLFGIDAQKLVALAPDLIVTQSQCDVCAVSYEDVVSLVRSNAALQHAQIVSLNPQSLSDVWHDIERIAGAANCDARPYLQALKRRLEAIAAATGCMQAQEKPRIVCIEWIEPLMLAGNWVPEIIDTAGGQCDLTQSGDHSPYVTWERVVVFDPQVIIIAPCGFDLSRSMDEAVRLRKLDGWSRLTAVREKRVFVVDGNALLNRSGPRLVDTTELLAHLLHPDRFAVPQISGLDCAWNRFETV